MNKCKKERKKKERKKERKEGRQLYARQAYKTCNFSQKLWYYINI